MKLCSSSCLFFLHFKRRETHFKCLRWLHAGSPGKCSFKQESKAVFAGCKHRANYAVFRRTAGHFWVMSCVRLPQQMENMKIYNKIKICSPFGQVPTTSGRKTACGRCWCGCPSWRPGSRAWSRSSESTGPSSDATTSAGSIHVTSSLFWLCSRCFHKGQPVLLFLQTLQTVRPTTEPNMSPFALP